MKARRIMHLQVFDSAIDIYPITRVKLDDGEIIALSQAFVEDYQPRVGGFLIHDVKGFASFSMTRPEEKLVPLKEPFDFGKAISALKAGYAVARSGWNGKGMWLMLQKPDAHSKMTLPYIYMKTADNQQVPWLASQTDMLAEDWSIVE